MKGQEVTIIEVRYLLIPLKGETTDGHLHIEEALRRGAAGSLCSRGYYEEHGDGLRASCAPLVLVDDTLGAFWTLAERYLEKFPNLVRLGVTGSSGKTTTKEILGSVFSLFSSTIVNEGNLNSETGLPLSVLGVRSRHAYGIFEMGINHPGEMDVLARIVRPRAAIITNIGTAHIGLLGSRRAIAEEKRKIFTYLDKDGVAFIPEDESFSDVLVEGLEAEVVRFGAGSTEGYQGAKDLGLHGWELEYAGRIVHFPLIGEFNLQNALCAITVARYFGIDEMTVCTGLEKVKPLFGRGQILHGRVTVLHDCYNANPHSLHEALGFLDRLDWKGRKIAVLGAMKELGSETAELHETITRRAVESSADKVFLVGEEYAEACERIPDDSRGRFRWFAGVDELLPVIRHAVGTDDIVLVKGSRETALERITDYIV